MSESAGSRNREQIAALAYELWQARGCPEGTADEDWFQAEREMARLKRLEENPDSCEVPTDAGDADPSPLRFPVRSEVSRASHGTAKRA